jgi:hypothetical protein
VRRWCWHNIFVFIFLRGFLGTVVCVFIASLLGQWAGHVLPNVNDELSHMALAHGLERWRDHRHADCGIRGVSPALGGHLVRCHISAAAWQS